MRWSLYIGKVSGIKIFIHWTFLILILWIILVQVFEGHKANEILLNITFIIAVFACIVLHELGHALTAKRFNSKTKDIILLPIGGLARMESLPEKPMQELLVAVMGPAVNIVISGILFIILKMTNAFPSSINNLNITETNFWFQLFAVNLFLALFNFIPAFPMDGGRVLRALLSLKLPRLKATRIAAYAGQFIAMLFVFFGFSYNPMLVFIGFFIFLGAQSEAKTEETISALREIKVSDVLMHRYSVLRPDESLSKAVDLLLDSQEHSFIVKDNDEVQGTLSRKEIIEGLSKFGKNIPVSRVMQSRVASLKPGDMLRDVMQKFSGNAETIMPVFDGQKIIGVLDLENITEFVQIQNALSKS
ncbi:MAG TPA: site-2 protease family protein [Chitinophagaceae bacterium]|jgi:Zn-dependent protease|nr:site-2 protease family protein [Chitinophagaceae bacterium]